MSRMEPTEFVDDRYDAIENRLKVRLPAGWIAPNVPSETVKGARAPPRPNALGRPSPSQVVRSRLNRPLTFAEKARSRARLSEKPGAARREAAAMGGYMPLPLPSLSVCLWEGLLH